MPTVINAEGTMTMLGGSLIRPEVEVVMAQASRHFVSIPALEEAAGKRIAQMLKLPDGYSALVTSGAAAAIQSGLAGILTASLTPWIAARLGWTASFLVAAALCLVGAVTGRRSDQDSRYSKLTH